MNSFRSLALLVLAAGIFSLPASAEQGLYSRVSITHMDSRDTVFRDRSCTPGDELAAYFGCVEGDDGRPIGAYGDFGNSVGIEMALGYRLASAWRSEVVFAYQPEFSFRGNANFLDTGADEPVRGDVRHALVGLRAYLDLARLTGEEPERFDPYLGLGVGLARNRIGTTVYEFPELASQPASTRVPGETRYNLGWMATVGSGLRLTARHTLDLGLTYSDHGRVSTPRGAEIEVIRNGQLVAQVPVEETRARLRGFGLVLGVRSSF